MTSHTVNDIPADFKSTLPPRKRAKTQEEKEQRRIERILRNRKAAHQSREKKRLHLLYLERKCALLERIVAHVDLGALVAARGDAALGRAVTEYEAVAREGSGTPSFAITLADERSDKDEGAGLSAATTPSVKSPCASGATPGSPCTTVGEEAFGRRDFVLEAKPEPLAAESYSYGAFAPAYEEGPRAFGGRPAASESWNLLLTQSQNYPLGGSSIFKDDLNEPFELTDSSVDFDHWRNPAAVVQWKRRV
ncbi:ACR216Cp [Eremothecium gossypii ATCC 10895]|uniref:ACR216Cp n=1 Tax=Eremothecium gossypii (strain ATCC 10895 / CBS 109.51 / FGSC 9923 / NRRL Y-1056) TaxID=284811 RepID=Q75BQ5_EREGS|nr:ACR216Cp [Eremothecium gossypii ATCC 10895]AAS51442.2 ACR216Cp [Eremothecium gossypii ATCC 10895]AEY95733.1 FACR216Cp [Eremothecium gossypii FDAG1]